MSQTNGSAAVTTLFDLDGVLTRRDTMASLVARQLSRRPLRLLAALPLFLLSLAAPSTGELRPRINRRLVALALAGMTTVGYRVLAEETGRRLARQPDFPRHRAIREAQDRAGSGCTVVVVTASERWLAQAYLDNVGLSAVELLASEVSFVDGRPRFIRHNVGKAKVERVESADVDLRASTLYTDSASDLPLALLANRTILVNPAPGTRRTMAKWVPAATSVRWS